MIAAFLAALLVVFAVFGVPASVSEAFVIPVDGPVAVTVDGSQEMSCGGLRVVANDRGYSVSFVDILGLQHRYEGVKKVETMQLPDLSVCRGRRK